MNSHFYDEDMPPDASRTFRPVMPAKPERFALRAVISIVLIALGCALLLTAGH